MENKHKILQKLDEYLDNATPEQLEKDWAELEKYNHDGPEMLDVLRFGVPKKEIDEERLLLREVLELEGRATGATTRLADEYIQKLYEDEGQWIEIHDHYGTVNADRLLLDKIIKRLELEHPMDSVHIDYNKRSIMVKSTVRENVRQRLDKLTLQLVTLNKTYEPFKKLRERYKKS